MQLKWLHTIYWSRLEHLQTLLCPSRGVKWSGWKFREGNGWQGVDGEEEKWQSRTQMIRVLFESHWKTWGTLMEVSLSAVIHNKWKVSWPKCQGEKCVSAHHLFHVSSALKDYICVCLCLDWGGWGGGGMNAHTMYCLNVSVWVVQLKMCSCTYIYFTTNLPNICLVVAAKALNRRPLNTP